MHAFDPREGRGRCRSEPDEAVRAWMPWTREIGSHKNNFDDDDHSTSVARRGRATTNARHRYETKPTVNVLAIVLYMKSQPQP
jgi:hypothetical protein